MQPNLPGDEGAQDSLSLSSIDITVGLNSITNQGHPELNKKKFFENSPWREVLTGPLWYMYSGKEAPLSEDQINAIPEIDPKKVDHNNVPPVFKIWKDFYAVTYVDWERIITLLDEGHNLRVSEFASPAVWKLRQSLNINQLNSRAYSNETIENAINNLSTEIDKLQVPVGFFTENGENNEVRDTEKSKAYLNTFETQKRLIPWARASIYNTGEFDEEGNKEIFNLGFNNFTHSLSVLEATLNEILEDISKNELNYLAWIKYTESQLKRPELVSHLGGLKTELESYKNIPLTDKIAFTRSQILKDEIADLEAEVNNIDEAFYANFVPNTPEDFARLEKILNIISNEIKNVADSIGNFLAKYKTPVAASWIPVKFLPIVLKTSEEDLEQPVNKAIEDLKKGNEAILGNFSSYEQQTYLELFEKYGRRTLWILALGVAWFSWHDLYQDSTDWAANVAYVSQNSKHLAETKEYIKAIERNNTAIVSRVIAASDLEDFMDRMVEISWLPKWSITWGLTTLNKQQNFRVKLAATDYIEALIEEDGNIGQITKLDTYLSIVSLIPSDTLEKIACVEIRHKGERHTIPSPYDIDANIVLQKTFEDYIRKNHIELFSSYNELKELTDRLLSPLNPWEDRLRVERFPWVAWVDESERYYTSQMEFLTDKLTMLYKQSNSHLAAEKVEYLVDDLATDIRDFTIGWITSTYDLQEVVENLLENAERLKLNIPDMSKSDLEEGSGKYYFLYANLLIDAYNKKMNSI